uniref:G protein-coupled receptor n=1 Tax=Ditylenchus dipsaci TaxID=166011 RepID=A0A915E3N7_9BILA
MYKHNKCKRKMQAGVTLSTRYQYNENMVTTKALVPAVGGFALFVIPGTCLAIYTSCVIKRDGEQCTYVKLLIQILFMIADSYQMFFMGYLALNFKPLYIQIRKDFAKILPINASEYRVQTCCTDINVTATYFNDLDRCWSVVNEHKKFKKQTIIVKKRKRPVNRRTTAKWNNNFV